MIGFPDQHHLRAAQGWVELRVFDEAAKDLKKIRPQFRNHPEVLELSWVIAARMGQWSQALSLARKLARLAPESMRGWANEANSLIKLHRPAEAYFLLLRAQQRFPGDENVTYDLGRVCCILGRPEEGFGWIRHAIELGGFPVERRATGDPELQALWKDLRRNRRRQSS